MNETPFTRQFKKDAEALRHKLSLCPRCQERPFDPIFLGKDGEGHICGECWTADRHDEAPAQISDQG